MHPAQDDVFAKPSSHESVAEVVAAEPAASRLLGPLLSLDCGGFLLLHSGLGRFGPIALHGLHLRSVSCVDPHLVGAAAQRGRCLGCPGPDPIHCRASAGQRLFCRVRRLTHAANSLLGGNRCLRHALSRSREHIFQGNDVFNHTT